MKAEPACIIRADDARVHRAISRRIRFRGSGFKVSFTTACRLESVCIDGRIVGRRPSNERGK